MEREKADHPKADWAILPSSSETEHDTRGISTSGRICLSASWPCLHPKEYIFKAPTVMKNILIKREKGSKQS